MVSLFIGIPPPIGAADPGGTGVPGLYDTTEREISPQLGLTINLSSF
jgi:hypothetical protein